MFLKDFFSPSQNVQVQSNQQTSGPDQADNRESTERIRKNRRRFEGSFYFNGNLVKSGWGEKALLKEVAAVSQ